MPGLVGPSRVAVALSPGKGGGVPNRALVIGGVPVQIGSFFILIGA